MYWGVGNPRGSVRIVFYKEVLKIALIGIACSTFDLFAQSAARVYPFPLDPREHPDDTRRGVKPPDAGTFKNQLQFIALRSMGDNYMTDLERYVVKDRLGDILWPHYSMLYHPACKEMVQEIKKRDLYLFDLWVFVPGTGKDFDCAEHDMLNDVLEKSAALGVKDILLARHRYLEQNMTAEKVRESMAKNLKPLITALDQKGCRLVYDAIYDNADEEYADAKLIESLK